MAEECDSIYFYDPSFPAAVTFVVLYAIPTIFLLYLILFRYRSWYFLCVPIGGLLEVAGYGQRSASVKNVCDVGMYASSVSLIVIAPLLIAAGNYLLIGRLILSVLPPTSHKILGVSAHRITKIFVGADIMSFLIQVSGSGIASSNNWRGKTEKIGVNVLIAGLSTQLATILFFVVIVGVFGKRAVLERQARDQAPEGWRKVLAAISISSTLITLRSIYRLIEFASGIDGYLIHHEWPFYTLEAAPMLPALAIFCLWFPPQYLPKKRLGNDVETSGIECKPVSDSADKT